MRAVFMAPVTKNTFGKTCSIFPCGKAGGSSSIVPSEGNARIQDSRDSHDQNNRELLPNLTVTKSTHVFIFVRIRVQILVDISLLHMIEPLGVYAVKGLGSIG